MKKNIDVSVIIPVFNVECYLKDALISAVTQSFSGVFEIIVINDASADGSHEICEVFNERYPDLISYVKHDSNMGVSIARNRGLSLASGKYIMFLDPDDFLTENAIQYLYDAAEHLQADVVKGNNQIFNSKKSTYASYNTDQQHVFLNGDGLTVFLTHELIRGHPWGKLFLRERFSHIKFPVGVRMAQDFSYCSKIFAQSKKLVIIDDPVYFYRLRAGGSTGNKYHSQAYKHWFASIEDAGALASSSSQKVAYKQLLLRTLHQSMRECRKLEGQVAYDVFHYIITKQLVWGVTAISLVKSGAVSPKSFLRFIQYKWLCYKLRSKLKPEIV